MKKKLSLARLSKNDVKFIKGGAPQCDCGCYYVVCGSSDDANDAANTAEGLTSPWPSCNMICLSMGVSYCPLIAPPTP